MEANTLMADSELHDLLKVSVDGVGRNEHRIGVIHNIPLEFSEESIREELERESESSILQSTPANVVGDMDVDSSGSSIEETLDDIIIKGVEQIVSKVVLFLVTVASPTPGKLNMPSLMATITRKIQKLLRDMRRFNSLNRRTARLKAGSGVLEAWAESFACRVIPDSGMCSPSELPNLGVPEFNKSFTGSELRAALNRVRHTVVVPDNVSYENMAYPGTASSPPCRPYRGPQDYMAMKQTSISTRGSSENIVLPEDVTEQGSVMPLQMEMVTEQSSIESVNSLQAQSGPGTSSPHHKKVKLPKHQRKSPHVPGRESESPWNPGVKPENFGSPQYNASMYSMMFGRLPIKRTDMISDESEDEDDDDYDNIEGEGYSNQSSMDIKSQQRELVAESGGPRLGYECGECDMVADTRPSLKKHIAVCHPLLAPDSALITKTSSACPMVYMPLPNV
uniref:(California timema) hypothetical protein n=1 Tax=Timema californicum TaxID=61474 RepID=A0A7R9J5D8_TIMCA|nr:unnamed protein product [Timema californicum]